MPDLRRMAGLCGISLAARSSATTYDRGSYVPKIFIALDGECKNHPAVLRQELEEG